MSTTIAAIFVTHRADGCKAVCFLAHPREFETHEDCLQRLIDAVAPDIPAKTHRTNFCHYGDGTCALFELPPQKQDLFHEDLWQHPTVVLAPIADNLPQVIKHRIAKSY